MAYVIRYLNTNKRDNPYKGQHLKHPVLPDDTLCGIAISDNRDNLKIEIKQGKVTCSDCVQIINFCKTYNK